MFPCIPANREKANRSKTTVMGVYSRASQSWPATVPRSAVTPTTVSLVLPTEILEPMGSALPNRSSASVAPRIATLVARSTSVALNHRPVAIVTSRTVGKSGVVPRMVTLSMDPAPYFTVCIELCSTETPEMLGTCSATASASSYVRLPPPIILPALTLVRAKLLVTKIRLAPRLLI